MDTHLEAVRDAIRQGNKDLARELLRDLLKSNPSADAWYLASMVTGNREQAKKFLQLAINLDPFHDKASAALDKLTQENSSVGTTQGSGSNNQHKNLRLLQEAISVFAQNDWDLKMQVNNMAQLEKKKGPNALLAALVIVFF